jgi:hypothetical protein
MFEDATRAVVGAMTSGENNRRRDQVARAAVDPGPISVLPRVIEADEADELLVEVQSRPSIGA